jgi:hypothetical protein
LRESVAKLDTENHLLKQKIERMERQIDDGGSTIMTSTSVKDAFVLLAGLWQQSPRKLKELGKLLVNIKEAGS